MVAPASSTIIAAATASDASPAAAAVAGPMSQGRIA